MMGGMSDRNQITDLLESGWVEQRLLRALQLFRETEVVEQSVTTAREFSRHAVVALRPVPVGEANDGSWTSPSSWSRIGSRA